ncbi:hypothetical protein ARTSIC4J27_3494 [Pseudarthrobacter siccitolerans]|uniref:Uncharacterized protein n=1 Tax=Pseudarthrobacter siccitolerans TaxID=861266 RepID=A0A024H710_9MICC|nr:hypothetical protein ARTSIC4J27_3494 [Pseudarthrobacter siccitolerans]
MAALTAELGAMERVRTEGIVALHGAARAEDPTVISFRL